MGVFDMLNVLSGNEVTANDLFGDTVNQEPPKLEENNNLQQEKTNEENTVTEILNATAEDIFGGESESVSNEENNKEKEDTTSSNKDSESPDKPNFYSSITDALVDDGVFPDLSPNDVLKIQSPEDFRELIESLIKAGLDERNKRIDEALKVGVEPNEIRNFENTLNYLESITPDLLAEESSRGEDIRRRILQQDFMNKGYSLERAAKMTDRLFTNAEDIEEAKLALEENKKHFTSEYNKVILNAKNLEELERKEREKLAESLKKDILSNGKIFDDIEIDKATRQKVVDNIMKATYKDPDSGGYLTAILKYEQENRNEFIKNVGILFTLTDGFTNMGRLVRPSAKKEVKAKLKELEQTLNNSANFRSGNHRLVGNNSTEKTKPFWEKGFVLDIN